MPKPDEPNKVIYSMVGVGKVHGPKQVLKDIYLGYFYSAKIGVIGLKGPDELTFRAEPLRPAESVKTRLPHLSRRAWAGRLPSPL